MTLSLRSRIVNGLRRSQQKYAGHRDLASIIATVETLLRMRGDIYDSAVLVSDLEGVVRSTIEFHLDSTKHGDGAGNDTTPGGGPNDHGALTGLGDDDHPQYHTDARGDIRYAGVGHSHDGTYVRLIGDTMTGNLTIDRSGGPGNAAVNVGTIAANTTSFNHLSDGVLVARMFRQTAGTFAMQVVDVAAQNVINGIFNGATNLFHAGVAKLSTLATGGTLTGTWNATVALQQGGVGVAPITHVGAGGAQHPVFTAAVAGFVPPPVTPQGYVLSDGGNWVPRIIGASGAVEANFRWDTTVAASPPVADPGAGDIQADNADPNLATWLAVSDETINGVPILQFWGTLRAGDFVMIVKNAGPEGGKVWKVTGTPTIQGVAPNQWANVPVESPVYATIGAAFANNGAINVGLIYSPDSRVPTAGLTGQFLAKTSNADYAMAWGNTTNDLTVYPGAALPSRIWLNADAGQARTITFTQGAAATIIGQIASETTGDLIYLTQRDAAGANTRFAWRANYGTGVVDLHWMDPLSGTAANVRLATATFGTATTGVNTQTVHVVNNVLEASVNQINNNARTFIANSNAARAAVTFAFPLVPVDRQYLTICGGPFAFTAVTLTVGGATTILAPITTLPAGSFASWCYRSGTATWHRVG